MGILIPPYSRLALAYTDPARLIRNKAPQLPSRIDWTHPLAKDLAFSVLPRQGNLVEHVHGNAQFTTSGSGKRAEYRGSPDGLALYAPGGASGATAFTLAKSISLGGTNGFTTMAVFNLSACADWGAIACWSVNGTTSRIEISKDDTDKLYVNLQNEWSIPWTIDFPLNKLSVAIGTHDGTNAAVHLFNEDGYQSESFASASSVNNNINRLTIGASTGAISTRTATGLFYQADIRQGVLADDEIECLLRDAYQYYKPANDRPYVLVDPVARPRYEGRGSGNGNCSTSTTTFTPGIPPDIQEGDLMLFLGHIDGGRSITSMTAGWTAGSINIAARPVYWRIYQSGDTAPTLTLDGGEKGLCYIFRISGTHQTAPLDQEAVNGGSGTTATCPTVTTSVDNCLVMRGFRAEGSGHGSAVNPADTTLIFGFPHQCGTTAGPIAGGWAYEDQITAGAVGTADWTSLASASNTGITIAIKPPEAGADAFSETLNPKTTGASTFAESYTGPNFSETFVGVTTGASTFTDTYTGPNYNENYTASTTAVSAFVETFGDNFEETLNPKTTGASAFVDSYTGPNFDEVLTASATGVSTFTEAFGNDFDEVLAVSTAAASTFADSYVGPNFDETLTGTTTATVTFTDAFGNEYQESVAAGTTGLSTFVEAFGFNESVIANTIGASSFAGTYTGPTYTDTLTANPTGVSTFTESFTTPAALPALGELTAVSIRGYSISTVTDF